MIEKNIDLKEIINGLNDRRIKMSDIQKGTGLSYQTIYKIRKEQQLNPKINTLIKLRDFLKKRDSQ